MMSSDAFEELAAEIAQLNGIPVDQAKTYLSRVGDTPEIADDGLTIVRDQAGAEVARILIPTEE